MEDLSLLSLDELNTELRLAENIASVAKIKQNVKKVLLNSLYGGLGNAGFRWFRRNQAEAITVSGQLSIMWAGKNFNKALNKMLGTGDVDYVCAVDTDSAYLELNELVKIYKKKNPSATDDDVVNMLDNFANKRLAPIIDEFYSELKEHMNAYENTMGMKREYIAQAALLVAKKKYAFLTNDKEGVRYHEPKLSVTGIEIVRSSTPQFCRNRLKKAVTQLLLRKDDDLRSYVKEVKDEFFKSEIQDIAKPSGVNNLIQYANADTIYQKGCPIHVRGALLYNHLIIKHGLTHNYRPISDGDKIKFCYLKMPNPLFENIISFPDILPPEFQLDAYVDYSTQFEKVFLSALQIMMDAAGVTLKKSSSFKDLI